LTEHSLLLSSPTHSPTFRLSLHMICARYTPRLGKHRLESQIIYIRVQNRTSIIIRGKAAMCAVIHRRESLRALISSTSTGTPEYYAYETRLHNLLRFLQFYTKKKNSSGL